MNAIRFLCPLFAALLIGCAAKTPEPAAAPQPTPEPVAEAEPVAVAEPLTADLLHHGGPWTAEEILAAVTEPPACPDCDAAMQPELLASEKLPSRSQNCPASIHGDDEIRRLALTYRFLCPACGCAGQEETLEEVSAVLCHGW